MKQDDTKARKRPGRVKGPPRGRYNVLLDDDLAEWGKHQPGGLSEVVRGLLKKAREEAESKTA